MNNVKKISLSEIAEVIAGQSPKSEFYSTTEGTPFLQGNRTFGFLHPMIDTYTSKVTKMATKGSVLLSVRAPVGDLNIANQDVCIGRGLAALNAFNGDNKFLYYLLKANLNNLLKNGNGTTYDSISTSDLRNLELFVPIKNHKAISEILSLLDDQIELNNKINQELEAMAQTLYNYWFIQFDFPNKEGNPYKSNGGEMIWNEELKREIPKGWEIKRVSDLVPVLTGRKDANFATLDGDYKFFTCSQEPLQCDEYEFEGNAILIAGNGDFNVKTYSGKFNAYQRTYVLIPENPCYYGYLAQLLFRNISSFKSSSQGSIVKFIKKGDIENIPVLIPNNLQLLENFNVILNAIHSNCKQNEELVQLSNFLLPMLMNGQVNLDRE